jgi:hypothetical protein
LPPARAFGKTPGMRRRALVPRTWVAIAAVLAACAPAAPVTKAPPPAARPEEPARATAPLAPARWLTSEGTTSVGPRVNGGRLVLVGGRRALVARDGSVEAERAPAVEALIDVVEVPTASGTRLVARGRNGVYRLDDPLGAPTPLARSEVPLARIGAWPGRVVLWDVASTAPRFLDVETGEPRDGPALPALPLVAAAFVDTARGAAVFEGAGLVATSDGGATFRALASAAPGDGPRASRVRRDGDALVARAHEGGQEARIDLARGTLGPFAPPADAPASEPAFVRWVESTGRDPAEAAVTAGVLAPGGAWIVASHGLVARVDPRSLAVVELAEFAHGNGMNACSIARAGRAAWIGCALSERPDGDLYDPFGVLRLGLEGRLAPERPVVSRNGDAALRVSPSGGAALLGPCNAGEAGEACARQPDGKWRTIDVATEGDLAELGAGALADGRLVVLRGLDGGAAKPRLVTVSLDGSERDLAAIDWPSPAGALRVESAIEEDEDGTLRFALTDGEAVGTFAASPRADVATPERVPGATRVRLHAGLGVAVGDGRVLASTDGGATFVEIDAPTAAREAATRVARAEGDAGALAVGEAGIWIDGFVRVGWGAPVAAEPPGRPPSAVLAPRARAATGPRQVLGCRPDGDAPRGGLVFSTAAEARALVEPKGDPPRGSRREVAVLSGPRLGPTDAAVSLTQTGPADGRPERWTLRFLDPLEPFGKVRSWSGPAPAGAAWGTSLRGATAAAGQVLATVRTPSATLVVRASERGMEATTVPFDLVPTGDPAIGADERAPAAWLHEDALVAWPRGASARVVARVGGRTQRAVGAPRADGVTLLVGDDDATFARALPIADAAPPSLPLDGWARLPPLRAALDTLPACSGRDPAGARVLVPRARLPVVLEGTDAEPEGAVADVRVGPSGACLAGAAIAMRAARAAEWPLLVRVDLAARRGEALTGGAPDTRRATRLACTLSPRP